MSDAAVERVREATDLIDVVSASVELKRAGANLKGLCPFHQEKTPSFVVSPERQVYHCFGCGAGGDVFKFMMETEGISFPEALQLLARNAGIELPDASRRSGDDRLRKILVEAQSLFRRTLQGPDGRAARAYLEKRGLSPRVCEDFGIGFAPGGWRGLTEALSGRYREEELVKAGVTVLSSKKGRPYDRFRNRITFPVYRSGGLLAGFGARTLGDDEPKYLNSPEGPLYKKGELLYGLYEARDALRRNGLGVLVEGYFDVLALVRAGVPNAVAPCGTALTPDQARRMRRSASRWIVFFDGDAAGLKATWRALQVLLAAEIDLKIAAAPAGSDPDDLVAEEGPEGIQTALRNAGSPISWLCRLAADERRRPWLLERVATAIGWAVDPLVRQVWVEEAASRLRVREDVLWEAVRGRTASPGRTGEPGGRRPARQRLTALERDAVVLMVEQPDTRGAVVEMARDLPRIRPGVRETMEWAAGRARPPSAAEVAAKLESSGYDDTTAFLLSPPPGCSTEAFQRDILRRLRQAGLQEELRLVNGRLSALEAGEGDDRGALEALLSEKQRLVRELEALVRQ